MNEPEKDELKQKELIQKFVKLDYSLLMLLYEKRKERFGEIVPTEVSLSTRPNKAILAVGTNLADMELLLKATENKGIDVYTHGRMIMAHSYPKLKAYPHLVGHFGRGTEYGLVDFASFPGALYMTKLALQRVDRFFRSGIFASDAVVAKGVITIKDNNYEPLIEFALKSNGFVNSSEKGTINIGFCEKEVLEKITEVAEKMEKNEIKHFFVIRTSDGTHVQKKYFEQFLELVPEDCFVLSFSYTKEADNVLFVPLDVEYSLLYKVLEILSRNTKISDLNLTILYTNCEQHTLSNLLNMKYMGIDDIYFHKCSPNLIKPSLVEAIKNKYNINSYTNPQDDIQRMLAKSKGGF